jgi:osmotically inducible protein OsmC
MKTEEMKKLYTAIVTVRGGRQGHARSSDGILDMDLKTPLEMGGPGGQGTNPEQLFAGGYAACFESALRHIARTQNKPLKDIGITAYVTLNLTGQDNYSLSVELHGKIDGIPQVEAMELMAAAHKMCPYSKATRGNIEVKLFVD